MIKFTVPGNPVAKGRARSFIRNGKIGHYTPNKTVSYENLVKIVAVEAMGGSNPINDAVLMNVGLYVQIPASWAKKKQAQARNGEVRPLSKPDLDNYIKAISDAMNGVVFNDDKQVVELSVKKYYSELPRAEIEIKSLCE